MIELLKEIWATVRHNRLRTALTGFAVGWGIFILIFLLCRQRTYKRTDEAVRAIPCQLYGCLRRMDNKAPQWI